MAVNDLRGRLLEFDGAAVSVLSEARADCRGHDRFFEDLIALSADPCGSVADGATWILKAELEDGAELTPQLAEVLVSALDRLTSWQSVLHVFQIIDKVRLNEAQAGRVIQRAKSFTVDKRPFLRAWSMHAIVVLGRAFVQYQHEAETALKQGEADKAASVRARARQLRR